MFAGTSMFLFMVAQVMKHVHYEDENTRYIDIGPVNKIINMLCCWFEDPDSLAFKKWVCCGVVVVCRRAC
jgi:cycloartenol synthase